MASKDPIPIGDAVDVLLVDHNRMRDVFEEFKRFAEAESGDYTQFKQELIRIACGDLKVHMRLEEELFFPAARKALPDGEDLLNEAEVEHDAARVLIEQLEGADARDPVVCAKFHVLAETVEHHVREEEAELFPQVRKTNLDLRALGAKMAARKAELLAQEPLFDETYDPMNPTLWERIKSAVSLVSSARN